MDLHRYPMLIWHAFSLLRDSSQNQNAALRMHCRAAIDLTRPLASSRSHALSASPAAPPGNRNRPRRRPGGARAVSVARRGGRGSADVHRLHRRPRYVLRRQPYCTGSSGSHSSLLSAFGKRGYEGKCTPVKAHRRHRNGRANSTRGAWCGARRGARLATRSSCASPSPVRNGPCGQCRTRQESKRE